MKANGFLVDVCFLSIRIKWRKFATSTSTRDLCRAYCWEGPCRIHWGVRL